MTTRCVRTKISRMWRGISWPIRFARAWSQPLAIIPCGMPFGCDLEIIREQARSHNTFFYQLLWGEACCGGKLAAGAIIREQARSHNTFFYQLLWGEACCGSELAVGGSLLRERACCGSELARERSGIIAQQNQSAAARSFLIIALVRRHENRIVHTERNRVIERIEQVMIQLPGQLAGRRINVN